MWAAGEGYIEISLLLLQHSADVSISNEVSVNIHLLRNILFGIHIVYMLCILYVCLYIQDGVTALILAAEHGHTEIVLEILLCHAEVNFRSKVRLLTT